MKETLLSALKAHDFTAIRNICFALPEEEKAQIKKQTHNKDWEDIFEEKHLSYEIRYVITYLMMCVCHSVEELLSVEKQLNFTSIKSYHTRIKYPLFFLNSQHPQAFMDFIHTPEGAYMIAGAQQVFEQSPRSFSIEILLALYTEGIIPFNEEIFVKNLYDIEYSRTQEAKAAEVLLPYPELATRVIPHTATYIDYVISGSLEWQKVFTLLCKKNYFPDKSFITSFIEVLLNPWKKNVLDMYCRWIEGLVPSEEELFPSQHTLFALLTLDKSSLINFAMKCIAQISSHPAFDFQAFADNFALCFTVPKIAKSQLIGVEILEKYYQKQAPSNLDYREQLAVLFTVPDVKLQEKVASLLTTYFNQEGLPEVIAPYHNYLKGKAQDLLSPTPVPPSEGKGASLNSTQETDTTPPTLSPSSKEKEVDTTLLALCPPSGKSARAEYVEGILFLIGDCIRERSPLALDLFFEGLCQLQAQIPADFSQQISPYQKQLGEQSFEFTTYRKCMRWVIDVWEGKASLSDDIFGRKLYNPTPFLREKTKRLLLKLKQGNTLPFVSTPTHAPFYIDPLTFLERIAQYEKASKSPMWEDVVVGLNRLLPSEITEAQKQLALSLTGEYAPALQYYFEVSKTITITDATRVLWGQVLRLKDIDGVFPELEIPQKPNLQGLVRPFYLKYEVKPTKINGVERNKIILEDNWDKKYSTYSLYNDLGAYYYNVSPMSKGKDEDIDYQLSLNPRYIDGWLCKYLLTYAQGVEGESLTEATRVMSLLLQYNLPIYHGGWLMVATCLLAERKNLRDLATEYILLSLQKGETLTYLAEVIGTLLAHKYAPIARFIEFLDMPTRDPKIKAFQKAVVEAYLPLAEQLDKKPTNHKKLADW